MLATGLCGLVILGTDTLIATALFHTCGHFKVLQGKIDRVNDEISHVSIRLVLLPYNYPTSRVTVLFSI